MKTFKLTATSVMLLLCAGHASATTTVAATNSRPLIPMLDAEQVPAQCEQRLSALRAEVDTLAKLPLPTAKQVDQFLLQWDKLKADEEDLNAPLDILSNVSPSKALRSASEDCMVKVSQFETDLYQNAALYAHVKATQPTDDISKKYRQDILNKFEDNGVQLPKDKRARVKDILDQLTKLNLAFARNMRDNPEKVEFTPAELKGLPDSYIAKLTKNDKGNYLLGFEYPEYRPFMQMADSSDARKRYQIAFTRRGTEANLQLLKQAMTLRYELAHLFGYDSFASFSLRHKMAKTEQAVNQFLADVRKTVAPLEKQEVEELRAFKAEAQHTPVEKTSIERWDQDYWQEKLRQAKYQIDQEKLREYFPTDAAQKWLLAFSSDLYGIEFKPVTVPVWNPDVVYYDVLDKKTGQFLGGVYMDMYPREGKYGHAAVWPIRASSTLQQRTPVAVLVTNLNSKGLNTDELETVVHEFGHALHNVLSHTRYAGQAGTTVENDFVEAPSQMYEEWARRKESLGRLADYCQPACPRLDDNLIAKLKAVHNYGRGLQYARQTLYAQYDMALHGADALQKDPMKVWEKMEADTALGYVPTSEFPGQFAHIMGGYEAGYYGYMWSQVLALDMLSGYGDNLMDPKVGYRYRQMVLSQGSQKPAADLVKDFLGRAPNNKAFFDEITGQRMH